MSEKHRAVQRSSEDEGSYTAHLEDLDVRNATFVCPDLTTFCRIDELGLEVVGQRLDPGRAVSLSPMTGAGAAVVGGRRSVRWCVGWRTNRWGGDPRSWMSRFAATGVWTRRDGPGATRRERAR